MTGEVGNLNYKEVFMEEDKLKYAQTIINVLQAKLNESIALNVQLEARTIVLQEELNSLKEEEIDANSDKTEKK
ncbi:hypothetical protein HX837_07735 [Marine Group I thaumarchaeote]|uniref:Uncharacterized protein n=1 Tax=Marine Group I thaumarchaeote TaxID=2511932 RepID=A0A7K4MR63_9ARCH|nr:hypothetical protein [Marine Group I thaumarchaeote]